MEMTIARICPARIVGILGVAGHLGAVFLYAIFPMLVVPYPALYGFYAAWVVVLIAVLWSFRVHPLRAGLIALTGAVLVSLVRVLGEQYLGWRG